MKPIGFPEHNCVYAKDQPQYLPLPVFKSKDGMVTSCWRMTLRERLQVLFTGKVWLSCLNFNQPLQPAKLQVDNPFK